MRFLWAIVLASSFLATHGRVVRNITVDADEVCFDKIGCFSNSNPWTSTIRPLKQLPKPPHEIGTRFVLFTRLDGEFDQTGFEIVPDKDFILQFSNFDSSKRTIFLIHGFTDSHTSSWVVNARKGLLHNEDINVIAVDWAPGARAPYLTATANSRVVGAQISYMIDYLVEKGGLKISDVQIIAHSLGGHVAGYAGSRQSGQIPHILAIDCTAPYFASTDPMVRLDQTDAKFVEVIHTNGDSVSNFGLGIIESIGHVDVFANGGKSQPGCKDLLGNLVTSILNFITLNFDGAISTWACSHTRGLEFYIESLTSECPFITYKCDSYAAFKNGKCYSPCSTPGSCSLLGYGSEKLLTSTQPKGNFYINTASSSSFCVQVAQTEATVSEEQPTTNGKVTVQIKSTVGLSEKFVIADGKISSGNVISQWIELPSKFDLTSYVRPSLVLSYKRGGLVPSLQPKELNLNNIRIQLTDKNFNTHTIEYSGVILTAGTDLQIQS